MHLLERLATNILLAQALLGRFQPNDVPSGYALQVGFHTARQLMRELRAVRDKNFPMPVRFAMRLAQEFGVLPGGKTTAAKITLGASLPADLSAAIATVKDLLPAQGTSTATAVQIFVTAGLPIEDSKAEVEAIRAEWLDQAVKLVKPPAM